MSSNNGTMPHTILSNVVSAYKSKFSKSASAPAPSTSSNASSTSSDSSTSPAVVANVNATSYMLSSTSGDSNTSSHHILSELISEHTDKQHKHDATTPASSTSEPSATANATATANSTADGGDDYYSAPCSSGPVPSQYEAFEEVSILLCIGKSHQKICMPLYVRDFIGQYLLCVAIQHILSRHAFSVVSAKCNAHILPLMLCGGLLLHHLLYNLASWRAMLTCGNCAQQAAPVCTCTFQCPD